MLLVKVILKINKGFGSVFISKQRARNMASKAQDTEGYVVFSSFYI